MAIAINQITWLVFYFRYRNMKLTFLPYEKCTILCTISDKLTTTCNNNNRHIYYYGIPSLSYDCQLFSLCCTCEISAKFWHNQCEKHTPVIGFHVWFWELVTTGTIQWVNSFWHPRPWDHRAWLSKFGQHRSDKNCEVCPYLGRWPMFTCFIVKHITFYCPLGGRSS